MFGSRRERSAKSCSRRSLRAIAFTERRTSNRVAVVSEGVDLKKMEAALSTPEMQAAMKAHTVLDPVFYIEVPGGK